MQNSVLHASHTKLLASMNDLINHLATLGIKSENLPDSVNESLKHAVEVDQKIIESNKVDTILPYLDICNSCLTQETFDWLSNISGHELGMTVAAYDYGVFLGVPENLDGGNELPEDLIKVLQYANSKGCVVVRFDKDAEGVDGIQDHNW